MKKMYKASTVLAVVAALALSLAGCSGGSNDSKDPASAATVGVSVPAAADGSEVTTVEVSETGTNEVPKLADGAVSVISDVKQSACEGGPGEVTAAGTVINRAEEPRDVVVAVSWLNPSDEKVIANSSAVLKEVAPDETRGYRITNEVTAADGGAAACQITAQAGKLAK